MNRHGWLFVLAGLVLSLALAVLVSPYASSAPDGLEKVAEEHSVAPASDALPAWNKSPLPDYSVPGVKDEKNSTRLAGIIGTLAMFLLAIGIGKLLVRRRA